MSEKSVRKKFTTTIDEDILKAVKIQAVNEDTSVAQLLERLINEYLDQLDK